MSGNTKIVENQEEKMESLRDIMRKRRLGSKRLFKYLCYQDDSYKLCYRLETSRPQKSPETKPQTSMPV